MPQPTNRQKVVRYLRQRGKSSTPNVTAKDVAKVCDLRSPCVAANYMREIFDGIDGVKISVDKAKNRRPYGTIYHITLVA